MLNVPLPGAMARPVLEVVHRAAVPPADLFLLVKVELITRAHALQGWRRRDALVEVRLRLDPIARPRCTAKANVQGIHKAT